MFLSGCPSVCFAHYCMSFTLVYKKQPSWLLITGDLEITAAVPTTTTTIHYMNHHGALGIWPYIQEVRDSVCDLESRLQRAKDNVEEMQSCMRSWVTPIFNRKDGRRDALLNLEDKAERLDKFYDLFRSSGEKIHFLLKVGKKKSLGSAYLEQTSNFTDISSLYEDLSCSQHFLIYFEMFHLFVS